MKKAGEGLRKVSVEEVIRIYAGFFRLGEGLRHLPFLGLEHSSKHKFGAVRHCPKWKSIQSIPGRWEDVKWRPLVSYQHHHWRRPLSMVGRMMTFLVEFLELGY